MNFSMGDDSQGTKGHRDAVTSPSLCGHGHTQHYTILLCVDMITHKHYTILLCVDMITHKHYTILLCVDMITHRHYTQTAILPCVDIITHSTTPSFSVWT
eukprot:TRINITY_DN19680_c0_g1_i2.p1 TRINITY_DN19680_c0_g1~~TRINITY_DN19680_c0_g1_i2.p1  ORF type:complete len:100 (+),score=32.33 TRINITY_DN19680_c0_g1_i2:78-377(+)